MSRRRWLRVSGEARNMPPSRIARPRRSASATTEALAVACRPPAATRRTGSSPETSASPAAARKRRRAASGRFAGVADGLFTPGLLMLCRPGNGEDGQRDALERCHEIVEGAVVATVLDHV